MLTIQRTGDVNYERWVKALICGDPGSGKTLISSTFPNPFYLTTEGLMMSVEDRNVPFHKITSMAEFEFALKMLQQKPSLRAKQFGFPVDTLIVDTIDDIAKMILRERMKAEKHDQATMQDYGHLKGQMETLVTALRNLNMNVVLTAHLKTKEVEGQFLGIVPAIPGSFSDEIAGYVDLALVLQTDLKTVVVGTGTEKVLERYLLCMQDTKHKFIKDHSGKLPQRFPVNFEDDYARIVDLAYPHREEEAAEEEAAEEADESVAEPATEPEVEVPEGVTADGELPLDTPEVAATPTEGRFACTSCGSKFDDEEQRDKSVVKHRIPLCSNCDPDS